MIFDCYYRIIKEIATIDRNDMLVWDARESRGQGK